MPYRISPQTLEEAEETVVVALESEVREERHLAAQAQLSHRLRNSFQRIDDKRQIDLEYLTCAEYQLFLDEMSDQGEWFQPDHWTNQRFAAGQARQPVKGVRPEDAEEFCRWLTQQQGGSGRYRLPSRDEAMQYPTSRRQIAAWCRDSGEFNLIGLASEDAKMLESECKTLFDESPPSLSVLDVNRHREALMFERHLLRSLSWMELAVFILAILLVVAIFIFTFPSSVIAVIIIAWLVGVWLSFQSDNLGLLVGLIIAPMCGVVWLILSYPFYTLPLVIVALSLFNRRFRGALAKSLDRLAKLLSRRRSVSDLPVVGAVWKRRPESRLTGGLDYEVVDIREPNEERLEMRTLAFQSFMGTKVVWLRNLGTSRKSKIEREQARLDRHWWLRLVMAREKGEIATWEGIRLVREF